MMKVEHIAWQVRDPLAVTAWYTEHLGFKVRWRGKGPTLAHFLLDESDRVIIEIYYNPAAPVPDYPAQSPFILHLAFAVSDLEENRDRLVRAGAVVIDDIATLNSGDQLAVLRDPWGFPLQLVKRLEPMI